MTKFKIYASMNLESLEPWIWTNYDEIDSNGYITITNNSNGKKIKCFKRTIDNNFLNIYNQEGRTKIDSPKDKIIVINEYYRKKLGTETQQECQLSIKKARCFDRLFLNLDHPNPQVQYGNQMAIWSLALGGLSLYSRNTCINFDAFSNFALQIV